MKKKKALPTIWEVPDELWARMEPLILELDPPKETGRPRINPRNVMDALIFRIRTSCQWNHIPRVYGDDSTIHRTFNIGLKLVCFHSCGRCCWKNVPNWVWWIGNGRRRMGCWARRAWAEMKLAPIQRIEAKNGSKKSILTDRQGGPLAIVVAGANVHDTKLLEKTIEAIVVERPKPTKAKPQHLCLDKGYDNPTGQAAVEKYNYTGHIRRIGEEKLSKGKKSIQLADGL